MTLTERLEWDHHLLPLLEKGSFSPSSLWDSIPLAPEPTQPDLASSDHSALCGGDATIIQEHPHLVPGGGTNSAVI